ncbi:hypothetical protein [Hyphomicrobium sp. NDB2Meth4]|uniref:hypothetical protein n=1 Tax=Hyphomicrobium sp. NDB2Meth4 TaxID=1892846 RepID=UPI000AACB528|nr:hypothetical protein [Hyphomicrobium sp. NDB2Meth4]
MKPSTSALIGAILASGGCLSLPAVAFASETAAATSAASQSASTAATLGDSAGTCHAGGHAHSSTCNCARCAAASETR